MSTLSKPCVETCIVLCSATGVGKTDLSLRLGEAIGGEIVNADMGQLYKPFAIGTAKPQWHAQPVKHHLFDVLNKPVDFSAFAYRRCVELLLPEIIERKSVPIFVGGSTFYIQSLFFDPPDTIDKRDGSQHCSTVHEHKEDSMLWHELCAIDPQRAQDIHPKDLYRIRRALTIWHQSGRRPSEQKPVFRPIAQNIVLVILDRQREELYERIDQRVADMMQEGWLQEVKSLIATCWEPFFMRKKLIGYDDIVRFLHTPTSMQDQNELIAAIARKTRKYAKRQRTFWRMLEKKITTYGPEDNFPVYTILLPYDNLKNEFEKILTFCKRNPIRYTCD